MAVNQVAADKTQISFQKEQHFKASVLISFLNKEYFLVLVGMGVSIAIHYTLFLQVYFEQYQ